MATDAKALQIALVMSAPFCQRLYVMYQPGLGESPLALATLTQWMARNVTVPNPAPLLIVAFVMVIATGKMLVVLLHHLPMVFAVTALVVSQLRAAAVSAWPLRFPWH